jgi:hypothetical protein
MVGFALLLALAATAAIIELGGRTPSPPAYPYLNGTLSAGGPVAQESSAYWSINTASPNLAASSLAASVAATGVHYLNFGFPGESVNQSAGLDYLSNGTALPFGGNNDAAFIHFCELLGCHATMGVPGEIDDPGAAAITVRYVEEVLGFHPAYWEIGNEPISWTHWGIPWDRWQPTDHAGVTPIQYAQEVQRYVAAIRSVDPSAQIIGIQSDAGAPYDAVWFQDLMALDGPNLSAVAYHSYAGGVGFPGNSESDFFSTLAHPQTFPLNYPTTENLVHAACPSCLTRVFVGEYNAALVGNLTPYAIGFPEAPYIAAGLLTGLLENASQVTFYGLEVSESNGLLDPGGTPRPAYYVYSTFVPNVTLSTIVAANVSGGPGGVYVLIGEDATRSSVWVVNTNVTYGLRLTMDGAYPGPRNVTAIKFDPGDSAPEVDAASVDGSTVWWVPPEGLLLVNGPGLPLTRVAAVHASPPIGIPGGNVGQSPAIGRWVAGARAPAAPERGPTAAPTGGGSRAERRAALGPAR